MNLFHLNIGVDDKVLSNADYDIRRYIDFINKSIELLKRETLAIKVNKVVAEGEVRYLPDIPSSKREEKAVELLFNENTKSIFDQKKSFSDRDSIRIIDQNEDENYITLEKEIQENTIYLRPDTYQLEQQKKALDNLRLRPLKEHAPLLNLFGYPNSRLWQQSFSEKSFQWQILKDETKDGVFEQREFVSKAVQTNDFALMEGPPGSGKTTTIIELIMQFAAEGKRVLLCSATHAAIDNVIERIKGRYKDICNKEIVPVRISRFEKPVKESVRPFLLKNLLVTYKADIEKHLKSNQNLESQQYLLKNLYSKVDSDLNYYRFPLKEILQLDKSEIERIDQLKNKYELQAYLSNKILQVGYNEDVLRRLKDLQQELISDIDPIEKTILDSSNLVAGTMVGILQHPDIRANKQGASFDVLIVDEASKVTFSDFIVPALHAKRWILVGDVKQLSPYVENDYVSENIATMIDEETQKTIVNQFELKAKLHDTKFDDCLKVYFTDRDPKSEKQLVEEDELVVETVEENWIGNEINVAKLNAADVVIAKNESRVKQLLSNNIQVKSIFINGETYGLQQRYRQEYFSKSSKHPLPFLFDSRQEDWSEMVSGRLNQSFSFRNAEGFENIDRELDFLIPDNLTFKKESKDKFGNIKKDEANLKEEINQIKRLVFPSILELLQNGIGKGLGQATSRVLSDGFHPYYKTSRFVSLTYQHRMHPDIAKTSRENFYENNLEPANTVFENRGWDYALNEPAVLWKFNNYNCSLPYEKNRNELLEWFSKHNNPNNKYYKRDLNNFLNWAKGKIFNPKEVDAMIYELEKFLEWTKDKPKPNGEKHEVAVLTFYLNQETELRRRIRKVTKQVAFAKFNKYNADIYLYTVDKFQGQEADLVLLGFTKFTRDAHFNSPNRLNVALTRARHKLILFGNRPWFRDRAKLKALRDLAANFDSTIRLNR